MGEESRYIPTNPFHVLHYQTPVRHDNLNRSIMVCYGDWLNYRPDLYIPWHQLLSQFHPQHPFTIHQSRNTLLDRYSNEITLATNARLTNPNLHNPIPGPLRTYIEMLAFNPSAVEDEL